METPKPSIGRIVHFHSSPGSEPEAALIIAVHSDTTISVTKCNSGGTWSTERSVPLMEEGGTGRFWNWPPRA